MFENIVLPSAGSLCVSAIALFTAVFQGFYFLRKQKFPWYGWGAVISLFASIRSLAIFVQFNTPPVHITRFMEVIQDTTVILMVHSAFGFYFSYTKRRSKRYHQIAGLFHLIVITLVWSTNLFVANDLVYRHFLLLKEPYVEPQTGPLTPLLLVYVSVATACLVVFWVRTMIREDLRGANIYTAGLALSIGLGLHDALATLGYFTPLQFLLEYGLLGFSVSVLAVASKHYIELHEVAEMRRLYLENVLAYAPEAIVTLDTEYRIIEWNKGAESIFGYSQEEAIGRNLDALIAGANTDTIKEATDFANQVLAGQPVPPTESVRFNSDGAPIHVILAVSPIQIDNELIGLVAVYQDITERKRVEEQIRTSLIEKEVLLKEIHHRVKNNMQVISSLLNLQSQNIKNEEDLAMFKESQNRVRTMALVHDKLYRSKDFTKIDFAGYIESLASSLYQSYGIDQRKILLDVRVEEVALGIDFAIPCGLIINELVSNALKYAFPSTWKGRPKIEISLFHSGSDEIELMVQDNGVGIPRYIDLQNTESLGLKLVSILAKDQLGGKIELDRQKGTKFNVTFKSVR